MGTHRFCWKRQFCSYFVSKIYLPCCCVVFLLPALQADLTRFRRVIVIYTYPVLNRLGILFTVHLIHDPFHSDFRVWVVWSVKSCLL